MEKVKMPKEVAAALDEFRNTYSSGYQWMVMASIIRDPDVKQSHWEVVLRKYAKDSEFNFVKIMQALVNGYEVEQTPEDKVREYIKGRLNEMTSLVVESPHHNRAKYRYDGAMAVAEILKIKIEGVNTDG